MKNFKIGMIALLMLIGNLAGAQQSTQTPEERATARSTKLTQNLGLTADQQKSVYDYCLQRAQQADADRTKYQGNKEAMRNARKQNEANFETNLYTILTADQKSKFEQMKQQRKNKGGNSSGHEQ